MNEVAADLRDLFASEIAKNKRLILEVERLQTQLYHSQQETIEWKTKTEKVSYEADLSKREKSVYMKEIERLQNTIDTEKAACKDLKQQIKAAQLQWKSEVETNKNRIEELQHIVATFAKTTKDLESKLAVAERPPTQIIEAVNAVRSAAEEEIVARLSSQESYFQRRLELVKAEIEQYRKKYEDARSQAQDAELRFNNLEKPAKDSSITTSATSAVSVDKRAQEHSRVAEDKSFSKSSEHRDDDDANANAVYLLSPRPGSTPTDGSDASSDLRKHLQHRSTRARTAKARKQDLDQVLAAAEIAVSRPVSASQSQKELEKCVSVSVNASTTSMKTSSYVGEGPDYFDSLFNNKKQVKFGCNSAGESEPEAKQPHNEQDATSGVVLAVAGPIRFSCVHPDGTYVRIRNVAETAEEIGGYLLIQLVDGKQVVQYRFPPSTCLSPGDVCTVWAGGYMTEENLKRLSSRRENIVWKDLKVWGAGANCTTVFAKPTGEALCWVHGALLDALMDQTSIEQFLMSADDHYHYPVDGRTTDSGLQVEAESEQKPNERKAKEARKNVTKPEEPSRRPKSPFHQHCVPDNRKSPLSPVTRRQTVKVRVDEFDLTEKAASRSESAARLSVSDTSPLVRPSPFSTHRKLIAQGLEILKAQHNMKFQPPMFNPRFPVPSN